MLEPGREPRTGRSRYQSTQRNPQKGVRYLALTFGTLLSSQGADALVVQPFRPSFETVSPMYTALRSSQTSRACPAVDQAGGPVRSRSVQREQYTTLGAPCTGVRGGGRPPLVSPVARTGDGLGSGWEAARPGTCGGTSSAPCPFPPFTSCVTRRSGMGHCRRPAGGGALRRSSQHPSSGRCCGGFGVAAGSG